MEQLSDSSALTKILANAPGNQVIWDKFLQHLAILTKCENSYILITDLVQKEKIHFLFSFNIPENQLNQYTREFNKLDNFNFLMTKNPRQVFCNQNSFLVEKKDFIDNSGFQYRLGFAIPCNSHHSLNLYVNRKRPFSVQEQQHISTLLQYPV